MVKRSNSDDFRSAVVQTAKTLFQQFGYKKTTVSDIARVLGKVKSAIYYYFPDKESLLRAVIDEEIGRLIWSIDDAVKNAPTPEEKLKAYALSRTLEIGRRSIFHSIINAPNKPANFFINDSPEQRLLVREIVVDG